MNLNCIVCKPDVYSLIVGNIRNQEPKRKLPREISREMPLKSFEINTQVLQGSPGNQLDQQEVY